MTDSPTPGAVTLFRVAGIPIQFHFTFLFLAVIVGFGGVLGQREAVMQTVLITALFGSVLLHELGHALTALRFGVRIASITMYPIGGVARMSTPPSPREELWITAAGPAVNLVIAIVMLAAIEFGQLRGDFRQLIYEICAVNIGLLLFNLIPAFPMDGGRLLRAFLALKKPELEATRIATVIGRVIAVMMGAYAIYSGQYFLLFIAFIVFTGAQQEQVFANARQQATGVPVHAAMTRQFQVLQHGSTIEEAVQIVGQTSQRDFPVMHGDATVGLVSRAALLAAMNSPGPSSYVASAMTRDFAKVGPDTDLAAALPLMQQAGIPALVMDGEQLLGLLTAENISDFFTLRSGRVQQ